MAQLKRWDDDKKEKEKLIDSSLEEVRREMKSSFQSSSSSLEEVVRVVRREMEVVREREMEVVREMEMRHYPKSVQMREMEMRHMRHYQKSVQMRMRHYPKSPDSKMGIEENPTPGESLPPEQAVYLAEQLGVNPVTAVIDQYRRDGGDNVRLNRVLSDMRRNPHQSPDKSQVYSPKSFMQSGMNKLHQHVGVQFSYLVPMSAHLRGVHVVGEKLFEISGEFPQLLEWEEYGLRIQVPEGATSEPCDIAIKAIVAGQLEFPEGTDLVSAVYAISVSKRLAKSVMLEIQHCAAITREEQGRFLSFVRAQCNQPQLPYQFELLDNGTFSPHSYYGKIACDRFSLIAAIRRFISQRGSRVGHISQVPVTDQVMKRSPTEQPSTVHFFPDVSTPDKKSLSVDKLSLNEATPVNESTSSLSIVDGSALPSMEYIAFMFHINKARNSWVWHFNVTKDLNALKQHVKKEHSRWDGGSYFQFAFHKQELQLELKEENFHQGWRIMPADYPCMLHKSIVDAYKDSSPPCCQVKVKASEGSGDINYPVPVLGITPAKKVFIQLDYQTTDPFLQLQTPPEHTPRRLSPLEKLPKQSDLLNQVAANASNEWENLGLQLDIKYHQLETLADKHRNNVSRFAEMFELWRKRGSPPYTWATIIDALRAKIVGNISLANDLEQWVINNYA